jgi:hypothetical protein
MFKKNINNKKGEKRQSEIFEIDQKKKYKRTNNDLQNAHIKLKIEKHEPHKNPGVNSGAPEG